MSLRTTESRYASKHDCPVGDVVFGGFAPSPMGAIRQTPEMAKQADEFWRKANEARSKAIAKLRKEIAEHEQRIKEETESVGAIQTPLVEKDRGADAGSDRKNAA
jgi:hypothetical protein